MDDRARPAGDEDANEGYRVNPDNSLTVSVVIPAFNAAAFIEKTLGSVHAQTYASYEVVVIDDGSSDDTQQVVEGYFQRSGMHGRCIRQDNKGIAAARNAGMRAATGAFIALLDHDDIWYPTKLGVVMREFELHPEADLICHDERLEGVGRKPRRLTHGPYTTYRDLLFRGNPLSPSATVIQRQKLMEVGGFSEDLRFNSAEDYDLWLRLAKSGCRIEYLHEVLGIFRQDGQGFTSKIEMHCEHCLRVLEFHFAEWQRKTPYYRYLIRKRRAAVLRGACREFLYRGEQRDAQRFWRRSLTADPLSWKTWALGVARLAFLRDRAGMAQEPSKT